MKYSVRGSCVKRGMINNADEVWEIKVNYVPSVINQVEAFL